MSRPGVFLYKGKPYDFGQLDDNLARVKKTMPPVLAQVAVNHFRDSFRKQGFTDRVLTRWKDRKSHGPKDAGRAIMIKSADLRNSINASTVSFRQTVVTSDKPYAMIHNEGFDGIQKVGSHTRRSSRGKAVRVKAHTRHMVMPQRQFMGNSEVMENEIESVIDRMVISIF
jgi:phage gpG-like protein